MKKRKVSRLMHLTCAVLFCTVTFLYLYYYQAHVLTVIQHVLSDGNTHYDRTIGAILLTLTLYLVHLAVYGITRLNKRMHAFTYFPSILFLTVLTSGPQPPNAPFLFGNWTWVAPLLLIIYVFVVYLSKKIQPYEVEINSKGFFSQLMWINVFTLVLMFIFVGLFSNHNDVFHYKAKVEVCIQNDKLDEALEVGKNAPVTDSTLTMLRAYALARKGELPERLFEYPLTGGSKALLPDGKNVNPLLLSAKRILRYSKKRIVSSDYKLMALLMDRKLKEFVVKYGEYKLRPDTVTNRQAADTTAIPKHYREALAIYYHHRNGVMGQDTAMAADYADFLLLKKKYGNQSPATVKDKYGKTYWWYYYYQ